MTDILFNDDNTDIAFDFDKGDFKIGDSEAQHILLLLNSNKGDWTQNLLVGVGTKNWINGRLDARFEREIKLQLEADNLTDLDIEIEGNEVFINRK